MGTGDFPDEYAIVNLKRSADIATTVQPHNMFMLVFAQLGLIGLISFLWIFVIQFRIAMASSSSFVNHVGLSLIHI